MLYSNVQVTFQTCFYFTKRMKSEYKTRIEEYKTKNISLLKNRLIDIELTGGCQRGRKLEGWVKEVKGLVSTSQQLQNSHGDVGLRMGSIVNSVVMTVCQAGDGDIGRGHFVMYVIGVWAVHLKSIRNNVEGKL